MEAAVFKYVAPKASISGKKNQYCTSKDLQRFKIIIRFIIMLLLGLPNYCIYETLFKFRTQKHLPDKTLVSETWISLSYFPSLLCYLCWQKQCRKMWLVARPWQHPPVCEMLPRCLLAVMVVATMKSVKGEMVRTTNFLVFAVEMVLLSSLKQPDQCLF